MSTHTARQMQGHAAHDVPERGASQAGLADTLRARTRAQHAQAETSGMIREILRGRADLFGYALLLRNLLPAYQRMEACLERNRREPGLGSIARPAVYRARALEADLAQLCGPSWRLTLPLLPSAERYAHRVETAAENGGARLIAHAYVRYLGDLSGGRILRGRLVQSLGLVPDQLSFYEFPDIADVTAYRAEYRRALDRAAAEVTGIESVVEEAVIAFDLNIQVSLAVQVVADARRNARGARIRPDAARCPGAAD